MTRRLLLALAFLAPALLLAESQQPPYEEKNWETNENMRNIFAELDAIRKTLATLTLPTMDIAVTTPTVAGQLVKTSAYVVYVSTNTTGVNGWVKVGSQ